MQAAGVPEAKLLQYWRAAQGGGGGQAAAVPGAAAGRQAEVFVRIRPSDSAEAAAVSKLADNLVDVDGKQWRFDRVSGPEEPQEQFRRHLRHATQYVAAGFSSSIIAYGQTGSGKTHTMSGSGRQGGTEEGVILWSIRNLLEEDLPAVVAKLQAEGLRVTALSVGTQAVQGVPHGHASEAVQLLDGNGPPAKVGTRALRDGTFAIGAPCVLLPIDYISGSDLGEQVEEAMRVVAKMEAKAQRNRTKGATAANSQSSRTHMCRLVEVVLEAEAPGGRRWRQASQLQLFDLAGSESALHTGTRGQLRLQGAGINMTLQLLVIYLRNVAEGVPNPGRGSIVTKLLKSVVVGQGRIFFVGCISPTSPVAARSTLATCQSVMAITYRGRPDAAAEQRSLTKLCGRLEDLLGQVVGLQEGGKVALSAHVVQLLHKLLSQGGVAAAASTAALPAADAAEAIRRLQDENASLLLRLGVAEERRRQLETALMALGPPGRRILADLDLVAAPAGPAGAGGASIVDDAVQLLRGLGEDLLQAPPSPSAAAGAAAGEAAEEDWWGADADADAWLPSPLGSGAQQAAQAAASPGAAPPSQQAGAEGQDDRLLLQSLAREVQGVLEELQEAGSGAAPYLLGWQDPEDDEGDGQQLGGGLPRSNAGCWGTEELPADSLEFKALVTCFADSP